MVKGKRGGARPGAGRKPKLPGKVERQVVVEVLRSTVPAELLDRLTADCRRGDYFALRDMNRLSAKAEQRILAERGVTRSDPPPAPSLFGHGPEEPAE